MSDNLFDLWLYGSSKCVQHTVLLEEAEVFRLKSTKSPVFDCWSMPLHTTNFIWIGNFAYSWLKFCYPRFWRVCCWSARFRSYCLLLMPKVKVSKVVTVLSPSTMKPFRFSLMREPRMPLPQQIRDGGLRYRSHLCARCTSQCSFGCCADCDEDRWT